MARSSLGNLLLAAVAMAATCAWTPWEGATPYLCGAEPLLFGNRGFDPYGDNPTQEVEIRRLQFFPDSLIYHPYLAGPREPRTGIQFFSNDDGGWSWFSTVGGQIGLLRYGTYDAFRPEGLQLDIEGAAQFRSSDADMFNFASTNVRFGFPLTIGWGSQETKLELCFFRAEATGSNAEYLPYPLNQVFQQFGLIERKRAADWLRPVARLLIPETYPSLCPDSDLEAFSWRSQSQG